MQVKCTCNAPSVTGQFLDCLHEPDRSMLVMNRVQKFREAALMAKAELARKAGVSESTVDRIEAGHECRMETKRKILLALGLTIQESEKLFPRHNGAPRQRAGDSNG